MLDKVDLTLNLPKRAAKQALAAQMDRLYDLQRELFDRKIPVIILFEGWDAAGKGTAIRTLTERLDPRGFKVLSTQAPRTHEQQKPWLWRFWMEIPRRGQIAIFDRSWYGRVMIERVEGFTPIPDWIRAYEEINGFERTLADDGTVFCKFWLHIDKEEQLRRFIKLTQSAETAWQVTAEDWQRHRRYDEYEAALRDMLSSTSTPVAPWTVVPSTDLNYKTWYVFQTIIQRLEEALDVEPVDLPTYTALTQATATKKKGRKAKQQRAGSEDAPSQSVKGDAKKAPKKKAKQPKIEVGDAEAASLVEDMPANDVLPEAMPVTEMPPPTHPQEVADA